MRRKEKTGFFAAAALAAVVLGGCAAGEEPKVIGEKQDSAVFREETQSREVRGEPAHEEGITVREQVQAPERYETEVKAEGMVLSAEAPVTVPNVQTVAAAKSRSVNFTQEEYVRVKEVLASELNIQWKEENTEDTLFIPQEGEESSAEITGSITETVGTGRSGLEYKLSYRTSKEGNEPPLSLIWMTETENYGRSTAKPARLYRTGENMEGQEAGKGEKLQEKASAFIEAAGFESYGIYRGRWRESYYTYREKNWSEADYQITFTPTVEGVACVKSEVNLLGTSFINGPYIDLAYREDGTLKELKIIGKEELLGRRESEEFLLPFQAIHQLFEQYCRDYFVPGDESGKTRVPGEEPEILVDNSLSPSAAAQGEAYVKVENVKLEYAYISSREAAKENEMDLVPVWNFYGSIRKSSVAAGGQERGGTVYWTARKEPEGLILSIRADDGQVLAE